MTSGGRRGGDKRRESGGMTSGGRRGWRQEKRDWWNDQWGKEGWRRGEGGVETREERVVE